jgi:hypothetical protein
MNWKRLHDQYNRCAIAWNDLYYAGNIARRILEEELFDTARIERTTERLALTTALVVTYARPFTTARGFSSLPSGVIRVLSAEQRKLHAEVLALRNEVYAHTDSQHFWATVEITEEGAQAVTGTPRGLLFGIAKEPLEALAEVIEVLKSELKRRQKDFEAKLQAPSA